MLTILISFFCYVFMGSWKNCVEGSPIERSRIPGTGSVFTLMTSQVPPRTGPEIDHQPVAPSENRNKISRALTTLSYYNSAKPHISTSCVSFVA